MNCQQFQLLKLRIICPPMHEQPKLFILFLFHSCYHDLYSQFSRQQLITIITSWHWSPVLCFLTNLTPIKCHHHLQRQHKSETVIFEPDLLSLHFLCEHNVSHLSQQQQIEFKWQSSPVLCFWTDLQNTIIEHLYW
jgi:hypothetical protein